MVMRKNGECIGTDLVGHIAVLCYSIRPGENGVDLPPRHDVPCCGVHDQLKRNPFLNKFPGGKPSTLEPGPRFTGIDLAKFFRLPGCANYSQRCPIAPSSQGASITDRKDTRVLGEEISTVASHPVMASMSSL